MICFPVEHIDIMDPGKKSIYLFIYCCLKSQTKRKIRRFISPVCRKCTEKKKKKKERKKKRKNTLNFFFNWITFSESNNNSLIIFYL